ncbi:glutamine--scyllo-inositol aminotransferase [Actinoplanes philippinensis]|uniref:dTDP-4-amino-4,6-dideoxygalactose transaminase n=1 Tax=Actinoplanes philippinensis TaxID=35752 RepID=A0A1I2GVN3_9ACTN|nr:DegT/DnrJ/EryC1/StrS family aminotransferase [Actinoplanes philippinensis]GIE78112.1 glutamine--scyllo-inositol aminotransferase [Actinoplanes philippinensis]SFF21119.1 dTDP-4-amino-4,6-dideoxygalactose transaminase [Actinoplanes philippinensis]
MTEIPLVDVKAGYLRQKDAIDAAIRDVVDNVRFINGPEVARFEQDFAAFCGTRRAIGCGSGTAALHLALAALGIGPGDQVAVPAHTFIASAEPISWLGATPRFVDVDSESGCLDPAALAAVIGEVKAVIAVHLYGRPADMPAIMAIADAAGVPVIEDAAQAHGAEMTTPDGRTVRAGAYGRVGCFSFFPGKNLGAFGDAGAVTTDDEALADRIAMLRDHGRTSKYEHLVSGYAHRLDTIQAAVLGVKLRVLADNNRLRQELARAYDQELTGVGDLALPARGDGRTGVFHLYVVRTARRDDLLRHLHAAGIRAGVHYPVPLHRQPAYAALGLDPADFPAADAWARECLSLPIYPELDPALVAVVAKSVREFFDSAD